MSESQVRHMHQVEYLFTKGYESVYSCPTCGETLVQTEECA